MMRKAAVGGVFGVALMAAPPAQAGVSEVQVGVMQPNICVMDCKNANKDAEPALELQTSFDSPALLSWAGSPRPYLVASINIAGGTSFAGLGVEWRWSIADKWALEPGVGYIVHDGEIDNPFASGTAEAAEFADENVLLGSRDLFRASLALTRDLEGPWTGQVILSHVSHGQILGSGRNQGMDQLAVRVGYQFGG